MPRNYQRLEAKFGCDAEFSFGSTRTSPLRARTLRTFDQTVLAEPRRTAAEAITSPAGAIDVRRFLES